MANNTVLNAGTGGDTIRDLDRAGVKTPVVALDLNPAGSETLMAGAMPVSAAALPLPAGASTAAKQAALGTAGTASADVLTIQGIASMTAVKVDGSAVTQPVSGAVTSSPAAATSGGATPYHLISAAGTNAASVKASAGVVYALSAFNTNAAARYLKLYDKAGTPTVGTDTPVATYLIPPSNGGLVPPFPVGIQFALGIALAVTGAMADADATAIGAGDVCLNIAYK